MRRTRSQKPSRARGRIHIRTRVEGDSIVIAIRDTGAGIPEHLRARIFDPFFTTKAVVVSAPGYFRSHLCISGGSFYPRGSC